MTKTLREKRQAAGRKGGRTVTPAKRAALARAREARRVRRVLGPPVFLWQQIEQVLRAHGPLDLTGLKAHVAQFVQQTTPRRIDAVILTELRRRPALFHVTKKGVVKVGPVASVQTAATCAHCGGPMPAPTPRRQSAPWRATHCRRWCARADAMATAKSA